MLKHSGMLPTGSFRLLEDVYPILRRQIEEWEHQGTWFKILEHLVIRARKASSDTTSYRGFAVGCAVWAHKPSAPIWMQPWKIFTAANEKPDPKAVKNCAERKAVLAALAEGYPRIIGLVVTGLPQPDTDSKLVSPTLHPCLACRNFLPSIPGMRADTRVLTIHLTEPIFEEMSLPELLRRHDPTVQLSRRRIALA